MRECTVCKIAQPPEAFHSKTVMCRSCKSKKDKGRVREMTCQVGRECTEAARKRKSKWQAAKADPLKQKARAAVNRAIDSGLLIPATACQDCGSTATRSDGRRAIQAHHHEGYDKPLAVEWLCPRCHRKHDDAARAALNQKGGA